MTKYVAFLRAINVGGHTVKMDHLRQLFEEMGFANVETFIASGNVIFEADAPERKALARRIEAGLQAALGYRVDTFVRSVAELAEIAAYKAFEASVLADNVLYVGFLAEPPSDEAKQALQTFNSDLDLFHVEGREVYWLCFTKISDSKFSGAKLEKTLGMPATLRNVNTVNRLVVKYHV